MFRVSVPLILSIITNYFDMNCRPITTFSGNGTYKTGDECNTLPGTSVLIQEDESYYLQPLIGEKVWIREIEALRLLSEHPNSFRLKALGDTVVKIRWKSFLHNDKIKYISRRFRLNNIRNIKDNCYGNDFLSFNLNDSTTIDIPPFSVKLKISHDDPKMYGSKKKRSIQCNGAGIGVGYGAGVTVVGVAVHTWCDTSGLEASVDEKYQTKFDNIKEDIGKQIKEIEDNMNDMDSAAQHFISSVKKFEDELGNNKKQDQILRQNIKSLQEWFNKENDLINNRLNKDMSDIGLRLLVTQIQILQTNIFDRIQFMLSHWSLNSRTRTCYPLRLDTFNPFASLPQLISIKRVDVSNIDLHGKVTSLFGIMKESIMIDHRQNKALNDEVIRLNNESLTINKRSVISLTNLKELGGLSVDAIKNLKFRNDGWYSMYLIFSSLVKAFILIGVGFLNTRNLYRDNPSMKSWRTHPHSTVFLLSTVVGVIYAFDGIFGLIGMFY